MKSYWIVARGKESVLEPREVPHPTPKRGQIVLKVHAAGLNRGELIVGGAVHGGDEKLGGTESAGVVTAVGEGVTGWKVGDAVFGRTNGAFAEHAVMFTEQAMPKPPGLSWEEAAAVPSAFITAYEAIVQHGKLKSGEWLLVTAASAGCGVAAIQIAKLMGAKTIGTSGSADKLGKLAQAGLDVGIPTRAPDFADKVLKATGGKGANIALSLAGGSLFPEILRSLAYEGRVAIVGYMDGVYHPEIDLEHLHINRWQVFGISNAKLPLERRFETTAGFKRDVLPAIMEGRVKPVIDRVFGFDELPVAKAHMDDGARVGKVVVRMPA